MTGNDRTHKSMDNDGVAERDVYRKSALVQYADTFVWAELGGFLLPRRRRVRDKAASSLASPSLSTLFAVFFRISLTAFGGGTQGWVYREIVERRRWLKPESLLTGLTVAQVLPGSNPLNVALYVGMQLRGWAGAAIAACGMVVPSFLVILAMGYLYQKFGNVAAVHAVLGGVAAVGIGATMAVAVKVSSRLPREIWSPVVAVATFASVGLLRWPLVPTVLVAAPAGIMLAYWFGSRGARGR